uniref:Uncharacterized protein n=1 Tax=Glossina morsitans morsitans TaxID=37546 RepID=A0A1B0FDT2_GLOMM
MRGGSKIYANQFKIFRPTYYVEILLLSRFCREILKIAIFSDFSKWDVIWGMLQIIFNSVLWLKHVSVPNFIKISQEL